MKKIAFLLALLMMASVALFACKDNKKTPVDDDGDDGDRDQYENVSDSDSEGESDSDTDDNNDDDENDNVVGGWTDKNDTVYVLHDTYLRYTTSKNDTSSNVVKFGSSLTRISTNGTWDKVSYNDETYYVYSYLTTDSKGEVTFTDITENNTTSIINTDTTGEAPTATNLRTSPCFDESLNNLGASALTKALTTAEGVVFKVTGINGTKTWARVQFTGKDARGLDINGTFYCRPSYLEYFKTPADSNTSGGNGTINPV